MDIYFAAFELENGTISTYNDEAENDEIFIDNLLRRMGEHIKHFTDIDLEIEFANNKPLGIRKANRMLREYKKSVR